MQKKSSIKIFLFNTLLCWVGTAYGTITLDSVSTTESFCANNGAINIYAQSSSSLLYQIISGPEIRPAQSGNTFAALPQGSYQVMLTNFSNDTVISSALIPGTYVFPDFAPTYSDPICAGSANGTIIGNGNTNSGRPPYTWVLTNTNTNVSTTQTSDSFLMVAAGNYSMRMYDSCQSFATRYVTLVDPNTAFYAGQINNRMIACDTVQIYMQLGSLNNSVAFTMPLIFQAQTAHGTYIDTIYTSYSGAPFDLLETVGGVTYGDYINITITNICGQSIYLPMTLPPFDFPYINFDRYTDSCQEVFAAGFSLPYVSLPPSSGYVTALHLPITIKVWNAATGIRVDSLVIDDQSKYAFSVATNKYPNGQTYTIQITDTCDNFFQRDYTWPTTIAPSYNAGISGIHCLDSTAGVHFYAYNFLSSPTLTLLSGPSIIRSTKPQFAYQDSIIYPVVFPTPNCSGSGGGGIYALCFATINFGVGTYKYKLTDSCGVAFYDSIVISPQDVADDHFQVGYKKGCPGQNIITSSFTSNLPIYGYTRLTDTAQANYQYGLNPPTADTFINKNYGTYILTYSNTATSGSFKINRTVNCFDLVDTLTIPPYELPKIDYATQIKCNGTVNVGLQPDSTKGIPPYAYEIISGPQTSTVQASNFFQLTQPGNYVARISDTCGFARTFSFYVDTLDFQQIVKIGSSCVGNAATLICQHSPYATYVWQKPNGSFYTGDSLYINPVTATDYGIYQVQKFVHVNNCTDTFYTTYLLTASSVGYINQSICSGQSFLFNGAMLNQAGVYLDTISTVGCDSIVQLNLSFSGAIRDTISQTICAGQSITIGTKTYSTTGAYLDSFTTSGGCDSVRLLNLQVVNVLRDTIQQTICTGQSFTIGTKTYNSTGAYLDSFTTSGGCDSVRLLNLLVVNILRDTIQQTICTGQSFTIGTKTYSATGAYLDSFTTSGGCDSVRLLNLQVVNVLRDTIQQTICAGQSITIGAKTYNITGAYLDSFTTSGGCDSVRLLNLQVVNVLRDTVQQTICTGQTFTIGTKTYNSTGAYLDSFTTSGGCDSIRLLNLIVLPAKTDSLDFIFCEGENISINGQVYSQAGIYFDTLSTSSCDSVVVIHVSTFPKPSFVIEANATEVEQGDTVQLNAISNQPLTYFWTSLASLNNNFIAQPVATVLTSSWFVAQATDSNNCRATDSIFIAVKDCAGNIFVPNAFTPNGDGVNDEFMVYGNCILFQRLMVFNRWGEKVFDSPNINRGWNGYYKGELQMPGVFVYVVTFSGAHAQQTEMRKGSVTLIR